MKVCHLNAIGLLRLIFLLTFLCGQSAFVAVVALLSVISIQSNAADTNSSWFYRAWQTEDGLPANSVTAIAQTGEGRLWLATHNGLATFDGVKFSSVSLPLPAEREHPLIRTMLLGRRNDFWLALEGGLIVRFKQDGTRVFTTTNGLPVFRPLNLAQISDDAVWISFLAICRQPIGYRDHCSLQHQPERSGQHFLL